MNKRKMLSKILEENYAEYAKIAISVVGEREAGHDALQDVALKLIDKNISCEGIIEPYAFITTCIKNVSKNNKRSVAREQVIDPTIMSETFVDPAYKKEKDIFELASMIKQCLSSYKPELQEAFVKFYVEEYPLPYLAKELGISSNALSQQFKRMRKRIANESPFILLLIMLYSVIR